MVVGATETVDYILGRVAVGGEEYLPEQVHAVVQTQLAYLREIGAIGGAARIPTKPAPTWLGLVQSWLPEKGGGPEDAR